MQRRRRDPFPFQAVRDLLAILRALWLATEPVYEARRRRIETIAQELRTAYEMASRTSPDTMGHNAAWSRAETAAERMGELVDALMPLEPVVTAARERVVGAGGRARKKPQDPRR